MPGPHPLQPLTIIEILDRAFAVYRSRFFTFFALLALVYLPIHMATVAYQATHPEAFRTVAREQVRMTNVLLQLASSAVSGLGFTLATGATTRAVGDLYLGEPVSLRRSYGALLRILPRYLMTTILSNFVCTVGFMMCLVPGLIFSVMFAFSTSVCVLEDRWGTAAMSRSRALGSDHGWRIFGFFLLCLILTIVVNHSVNLACGRLLPRLVEDEWTRWYLTIAASSLTTLLISPCLSIAWVLLYYDLRIRKEGFDLEVLARSLTSRPAENPPKSLPG